MQTEYTITYTYTGQDNTSGNRSVAFNRFTASGDTDRTIGQITSLTYEHYHTSTSSMHWGLRGQLTLADGSTLISDQVYNHISGNVVKYVNTFTALPSAEQFAALTSIQTLDTQGKSTAGGYASRLYWRATATYPMRIIVRFIEEPPVVYAPEICSFILKRVNEGGQGDDEGRRVATTLSLALAQPCPDASLLIYYADNAYPIVGESPCIDLSDRINELLTGLTGDASLIPGDWGAERSWYFALVFTAGKESCVATTSLPRAKGSLHVSGQSCGGVCICGYSSGTHENPLFESYAPARFYAGIRGVSSYQDGEIPTGGRWIDDAPIYRRVLEVEVDQTGTRVLFNLPCEIAALVHLSASLTRENGQGPYPACHFSSTSNYHSVWMETPTALAVQTSHPLRGRIILEYTKTHEEVSA